MAGKLSTHVLDTAAGCPAVGMRVELWQDATQLAATVTNADGRTDAPLLAGEALQVGVYELRFYVGDYFRAAGVSAGEPAFLEVVPISFGVSDPTQGYHVPLLTSPWSYSTYRGS